MGLFVVCSVVSSKYSNLGVNIHTWRGWLAIYLITASKELLQVGTRSVWSCAALYEVKNYIPTEPQVFHKTPNVNGWQKHTMAAYGGISLKLYLHMH